MAYIIAADEIKKTLPGYDPAKSEQFHADSAKLADKMYEQTVVLMSGGAASGKSEYVSVYLADRSVIVVDGTLPTFEGASIKIRRALKAGKRVEIHSVIPADLTVAYAAFLNRERKFSDTHFFRTHSHSRRTVLEIIERMPEMNVRIIESNYSNAREYFLEFTRIIFRSNQKMIEFVKQIQYTEEDIRNEVQHSAA